MPHVLDHSLHDATFDFPDFTRLEPYYTRTSEFVLPAIVASFATSIHVLTIWSMVHHIVVSWSVQNSTVFNSIELQHLLVKFVTEPYTQWSSVTYESSLAGSDRRGLPYLICICIPTQMFRSRGCNMPEALASTIQLCGHFPTMLL